jgi:DNA invertase Pin-like site-specific DNA recombinase
MAMVFSMAAEIERDLISKRTPEALQSKKLSGIKLGRTIGPGKSKPDIYKIEIEALLNNGSTQKFISNRYYSTGTMLCNWMKKAGLKENLSFATSPGCRDSKLHFSQDTRKIN